MTRNVLDESYTLDGVVTHFATLTPDRMVLDFVNGTSVTWGRFLIACDQFADSIREKVFKGDVVGVLCDDSFEFHAFIYGVWKNGAAVLLINRTWGDAVVHDIIKVTGTKYCFCKEVEQHNQLGGLEWQQFPIIENMGEVAFESVSDPDDYAIFAATSGTTNMPKCVAIKHRQIRNAYKTGLMVHDMTDVRIAASLFPVNSLGILGVCYLFPREVGAGTRVFADSDVNSISRSWISVIESDVDFIYVVPPIVRLLCLLPVKKGRSRRLLTFCAAAPVTEEELRKFEEKFPVEVYNCYGLTELTFAVFFGCRAKNGQASGTIGYPVNLESQLIDPKTSATIEGIGVGELVLKGHMLTEGYFGNSMATNESWRGGWFHTGDLVERTPEGSYLICGRIKDAVIRGGVLTHLHEVEHYVRRIEGVVDALAFKGRSLPSGDELVLVAQVRNGVTMSSIREWLLINIGREKVPNQIFLTLGEFPRNSAGKLVRDIWIERFMNNELSVSA